MKSYVQVEEQIRNHVQQVQRKLYEKNEEHSALNRKLAEFRGEIVNKEGVSNNAKAFVEINNYELLLKTDTGILEDVFIRISYENQAYNSSVVGSGKEMIWNERFEL